MLQNERGHAQIVEIFCGFDTLGVEHQFTMTTTRHDQHASAIGFLLWGKKHSDGRVMNVAHPIVFRQFRFLAPVFKSRRALFPERDDLRFFGAREENSEPRSEDEKGEAVAGSEFVKNKFHSTDLWLSSWNH